MGALTLLFDSLLHKKRGESDAALMGRRSALHTEKAENPYASGTKEFSEWKAAREDEQAKLFESQQW